MAGLRVLLAVVAVGVRPLLAARWTPQARNELALSEAEMLKSEDRPQWASLPLGGVPGICAGERTGMCENFGLRLSLAFGLPGKLVELVSESLPLRCYLAAGVGSWSAVVWEVVASPGGALPVMYADLWHQFILRPSVITAAGFLPGTDVLVVQHGLVGTRLWNSRSGQEVLTIRDSSGFAVSPHGRAIAVRSKDRRNLHIWQVGPEGRSARAHGVDPGHGTIWLHAFSPGGDLLAALTRYRYGHELHQWRLESWQVATGKRLCSLVVARGQLQHVPRESFELDSDTATICRGTQAPALVFNISAGGCAKVPSAEPCVATSSSGGLCVRLRGLKAAVRSVGHMSKTVWHEAPMPGLPNHAVLNRLAQFSPDNRKVLLSYRLRKELGRQPPLLKDYTYIWDFGSGREPERIQFNADYSDAPQRVFSGDGAFVSSLLGDDAMLLDVASGGRPALKWRVPLGLRWISLGGARIRCYP